MTNPVQNTEENSNHQIEENRKHRVKRINSWIKHARSVPRGENNEHISFLFYWIAYEAAYQQYEPDGKTEEEYDRRKKFHKKIANCEIARGDLQFWLNSYKKQAKQLLKLRQANRCFWRHKGEDWSKDPDAWEEHFVTKSELAVEKLKSAIYDPESIPEALDSIFDNLSVVRNQIVHGGSSGGKSYGKHQVTWGNKILKFLIPALRDCIKNNKTTNWGKPPFPRVGEKPDDECPPPWFARES